VAVDDLGHSRTAVVDQLRDLLNGHTETCDSRIVSRRRGWRLGTLLTITLAVAGCTAPSSRPTHAKDGVSYYRAHRGDFTSVLTLVSSGQLGARASWSYYGAKLPSKLCKLTADCRVANITSMTGQEVIFLAAWIGTPDDAAGWGHFDGSPTGGPFDGLGMLICPMQEAGDGWWWLDRPPAVPGKSPTCPPGS
jgi:hypothetical protein